MTENYVKKDRWIDRRTSVFSNARPVSCTACLYDGDEQGKGVE